MEIRYVGFEQRQNSRVYRFDVRIEGRLTKEVSISADLGIFREHRVGIQEGPVLCGNKLTADLERGWEGEHELTAADVKAFADTKASADARRVAARKTPATGPKPSADAQRQSPWHHFGNLR